MINKYYVFYGLSKKTKEKIVYWVVSIISSLILLFILKEENKFFQLDFPSSVIETLHFIISIYMLGLLFYIVFLTMVAIQDIRTFKNVNKKFLIESDTLNEIQKDQALKKIFIRRELYNLILKPNSSRMSDKKWKMYVKKVGSRNELVSRMKFLNYIEIKIRDNEPLKSIERDYLNEVIFAKEDIEIVKKIKVDVDN